jgi:hypothetical protein
VSEPGSKEAVWLTNVNAMIVVFTPSEAGRYNHCVGNIRQAIFYE